MHSDNEKLQKHMFSFIVHTVEKYYRLVIMYTKLFIQALRETPLVISNGVSHIKKEAKVIKWLEREKKYHLRIFFIYY